MYKSIIDLFYWLLIKASQSNYNNSFIEVESAMNKIVKFDHQGSIRK